MQNVLDNFERACRLYSQPGTREEGQQLMLAVRESEHALQACLHIIQTSQFLEARFHAAIALRECALGRWALLAPAQHSELRLWVLQYVLEQSVASNGSSNGADAHIQHTTLKTLIATHATLLKRQWGFLSEESRTTAVQDIAHGSAAESSGPRRQALLQVLSGLVVEFNPATASSMGMPWAFHEQCRVQFESSSLLSCFQTAVNAAMTASGDPATPWQLDAVTLMTTSLNWDFRRSKGMVSAASFAFNPGSVVDRVETPYIVLGPTWREPLLAEGFRRWLSHELHAYAKLAATGDERQRLVAQQLRTLLVQLCGVTGPIFESDAGALSKKTHTEMCAHGLLLMVQDPEGLAGAAPMDEGPLLDACAAVRCLWAHTSLAEIEGVVGGEGTSAMVRHVTTLTERCLQAGGASVDLASEWQGQASGLLLESWTSILSPSRGVPLLTDCSAKIFQALVQAYLTELAEGAHQEAADDAAEEAGAWWEAEVLERVATFARAALPIALPLLLGTFDRLLHELVHAPNVSVLEQLWWFLRLLACILADSGEGESPLVPIEILELCEEEHAAVQDLLALGEVICQVARSSFDSSLKDRLSPRIVEAAMWAFARWLDTYVLPEDEVKATRLPPPTSPADIVLGDALRSVAACILGRPGEVDLHTTAVRRVLHVLVCRRQRCLKVTSLPAWAELCDSVARAGGDMLTSALHSKLQRHLIERICIAAAAAARVHGRDATALFLQKLLSPTLRLFAQFESVPEGGVGSAREAAGRAVLVQEVTNALERLRGAVQGMQGEGMCVVFDVIKPCLRSLTVVQKLYAHDMLVSALLFKFAGALVDSQLGMLPAAQSQELAGWCHAILQFYGEWEAQQPRGNGDTSHQPDFDSRVTLLKALLKMLLHLTQRFDDAIATCLAEVVFQGLIIVLRLLSKELLRIPKVADAYFTLVLQLAELYAEHIAELPSTHFDPFINSIDWGLQHAASASIASSCFSALTEIAQFHLKQVYAGQAGLRNRRMPGDVGVLRHFMGAILSHTLNQISPGHILDAASKAMLPMIMAEPDSFMVAAQALVSSQKSESVQKELARQLEQLTQTLSARQGKVDRATSKHFETNFHLFVANSRGILHKM